MNFCTRTAATFPSLFLPHVQKGDAEERDYFSEFEQKYADEEQKRQHDRKLLDPTFVGYPNLKLIGALTEMN